jgi:hypothetical protein
MFYVYNFVYKLFYKLYSFGKVSITVKKFPEKCPTIVQKNARGKSWNDIR